MSVSSVVLDLAFAWLSRGNTDANVKSTTLVIGVGTMTTAVTISNRAARRISEILKDEGGGAMLRISVEGGGCSGFQYKFDIDHTRSDEDLVIKQDNAVVLVDSASQPFLAGSEIDFVDDLIGTSFRVNNPNATASCGCGTSFSI
jgi:iron-sulfur cluster assembly accessory protein